MARLNEVQTRPVVGSVADTAAISLSVLENKLSSLMKISILARSFAGSRGELSRNFVGGCQFNIFGGRDGLLEDVCPESPPPHPNRDTIRMKNEKSVKRCLPDFAILSSPNDIGRARGIPP